MDGVTPRSSASSATLARPSARRCSTRRARRSVSRMRGSCAICAHIVNAACAICAALRTACAEVAHATSARLRCRRWPTCLASVRGLDACSSPSGTFTVLALDHRQNLRKELRPADPGVGDRRRDGRLQARGRPRPRARPGRASCSTRRSASGRRSRTGRCPGRAGLIVAVEATGYEGPSRRARQPRPARLGRRAGQAPRGVGRQAPRLLPPGRAQRRRPGAARRRRRRGLPRGRTSRCSSSRSRSGSTAAKLTGEDRRRVVVETARRLTAIGADVLKAEFPYDARCHRRGPLARGVRRARRGDAGARGSCCRAASTTRRSSARCGSPARRARAACSSGGPCGPRRRRWPAPARDAFLATDGPRRGSRGWPSSSTRSARRGGRGGRRPGGRRRPAPAGTSGTEVAGAADIDLLVVGEVNPDVIVWDPDPRPVFGQAERFVEGIRLTIGSSSAITACGAARLGLRGRASSASSATTRSGRFMLEALADRGVDVSACRVAPGRPTGASVILGNGDGPGDPDGDRDDRATSRAADVPPALLARARHVHVGQLLPAAGAGRRASRRCSGRPMPPARRRASIPTGTRRATWDGGFAGGRGRGRRAAPERRGVPRAGGHRRRRGRRAGARVTGDGAPPRTVAVKCGADGALAVGPDGALARAGAIAVDAVDTTGAGDSFDAGFLAAWLDGRSLEASLRLGGRVRVAVDARGRRHGRPADPGRGRGGGRARWARA